MNLLTVAKMLVLLEQSPPDDNDDDAYFIIQRLLKAELRTAESEEQRTAIDMRANYAESLLAQCDKVRAIKMYRDRTKSSLYDAKIAVEEGARLIERQEAKKIVASGVTSCN